jgi:hypothetical protein
MRAVVVLRAIVGAVVVAGRSPSRGRRPRSHCRRCSPRRWGRRDWSRFCLLVPSVHPPERAIREVGVVRASYNQAEYLGERRAMMQQWADMVDRERNGCLKSI